MIWTWMKDGRPRGFFKTKKSLLISYDMMPLRGLRRCERDLNKEGKIVRGDLVQVERSDHFVPYKNEKPDIDAIDWGCDRPEYELCLSSWASYASHELPISKDQAKLLQEYYWRSYLRDKRRRKPLGKLQPQAEQILYDLGYTIQSVEFKVEAT